MNDLTDPPNANGGLVHILKTPKRTTDNTQFPIMEVITERYTEVLILNLIELQPLQHLMIYLSIGASLLGRSSLATTFMTTI